MKAIVMTAPGGADVLQPAELPRPVAGAGQLLVRLKAAGVNPVDTKLRAKGSYFPDRTPTVLGCDGAGIVEEAGPEGGRFKKGDEVYFCYGGIGGPSGNYAEYAVVDERCVAPKPRNLSFTEAAAIPLALITAWESLHDRARISARQRVLIHAGAGGVGHLAIQLAKRAGCEVITTVSGPEKGEWVRSLGADEVVNYREEDFVAALNRRCPEGVDVVFDTVGGAVFQKSFQVTRPYGDVVTLLQPGPEVDWKVARLRNLRISLELMLSPMYLGWGEALSHQGDLLAKGARLCEEGLLSVHVSRTFPLHQAAEAHRLIEAGGMMGKAVLVID